MKVLMLFCLIAHQGLACKSPEFKILKKTQYGGNTEEVCTKTIPTDSVKVSISHQTLNLPPNPTNNPKLEIISLANNKLTLQPGCFSNYPNLWILSLGENGLKTIPKGLFNHLSILKLDLNSNGIEEIQDGAFDDIPNLESLDLSHNKLKKIDPNWLKGSPKVDFLILHHNQLTELQAGTFKNIKPPKPKALSLWINDNNIEKIHPDAFKGLDALGSVKFNNNKLKNLSGGPFRDLKVEYLALEDNQIECLTEQDMKNLEGVVKIYLGGNPFRSDCMENLRKNKHTV